MAIVYDRRRGQLSQLTSSGTVTLDNIQDIETNRMLGRVTTGTGKVELLTATQVKGFLDLAGVTTESLDDKAPLTSPALTGIPTAPTATADTNTTQLANTAFVQAAIAALVNSSPAALDTLNELSAALGNDANFAATMTTVLASKAPLSSPSLTDSPTAPTAPPSDNSTRISTTEFVHAAIAALPDIADYVPITRLINGKDLSADVNILPGDIAGFGAAVTSALSTSVAITESIVGRVFAKVTQSDNVDIYLQRGLWGRSFVWWQPWAGNTTSLSMVGGTIIATGGGTSGVVPFDTSSRLGRRAKTIFSTQSASANAGTGFYETVSPTITGGTRTIGAVGGLGGFFSVFEICLSQATLGKLYVGMRLTSPPTNVEPDTLTNCILVGCKSGESNLYIFYAGSSIQTPINLGANFPTNTSATDIYLVTLHAKPGTGDVYYRVERTNTGDVAVGTLTAATAGVQLPLNTTNLCFQGYRSNPLVAAGVANLNMLGFYAEGFA